jgi:hypothetical protein
MSIWLLLLILLVVGLALWFMQKYAPIPPLVKTIIWIIVIVVVGIWLLDALGILPSIGSLNV